MVGLTKILLGLLFNGKLRFHFLVPTPSVQSDVPSLPFQTEGYLKPRKLVLYIDRRFYGFRLTSVTIIGIMAKDDDKRLAGWKEAFAKSGIKYETDEEYQEAIHNLVSYFEVLIEMDKQQKANKKEL